MSKEDKMTAIKFHSALYRLPAIRQAVKTFSHLAVFGVNVKKNYFEVKMSKINPAARGIIRDEFANFVLSLMKR